MLFYPGDWLRDAALRSCSVATRALWIDMLCFMHDCTPYGYLKVNNKVILPANLAAMVGQTIEETERGLKELLDSGVAKRDAEGCYYSERMVRDEQTRLKRASGGYLGGNPQLKKEKRDNHKVNLKDNHVVDNKGYPALANAIEDENEIENEDLVKGGTGEKTFPEEPYRLQEMLDAGRVTPNSFLSLADSLTVYLDTSIMNDPFAVLAARVPALFPNGLPDLSTIRRWGEAFNLTLRQRSITAKPLHDYCTHFNNWVSQQIAQKREPEKIFEHATPTATNHQHRANSTRAHHSGATAGSAIIDAPVD